MPVYGMSAGFSLAARAPRADWLLLAGNRPSRLMPVQGMSAGFSLAARAPRADSPMMPKK